MTDRVHGWAASAAIAILAVGFIGWRGVPSAGPNGTAIPNPALSHLTPYASPLSDTLAARDEESTSVALARDPFGAPPMPRAVVRQAGAPRPQRETAEPKWHVSATLIVGTKRAAIINDILLNICDSLPGGVTLTSVERDRVVLTDSKGAAHSVAVTEGEGETEP